MNKRVLLVMGILLLSLTGCGKSKETEPVAVEQEVQRVELDLTKLLTCINDSVVGNCGSEYRISPVVEYKLPDGTVTSELSDVNPEELTDYELEVHVGFLLPQEADKYEDMQRQVYIKAIVDISSYEVLSLAETETLENASWAVIF